jgi:protein-tyrosine-phosphatase
MARLRFHEFALAVGLISVWTFMWGGAAAAQQPPPAKQRATQTNVLFLCPHGAAKSVLGSAYFQRVADERGLKVRVDAAGIDPQEALSPVVVKHLREKGYVVPVTKPRAVTRRDVESADVVVSMGCDLTKVPVGSEKLRKWDDVPGPSENLKEADEVIRRRVNALVDELLAQQRK